VFLDDQRAIGQPQPHHAYRRSKSYVRAFDVQDVERHLDRLALPNSRSLKTGFPPSISPSKMYPGGNCSNTLSKRVIRFLKRMGPVRT
jgi:hypothetical protein